MPGTEALFLGLDASTQALKASLLDAHLTVLGELEVRFDRDLPHYGTNGGVSAPTADDDEGTVVAPVMLYVEALDMLGDKMREAAWPLSRIRAISDAGQQHASVYFSRAAPRILTTLASDKTLTAQVERAFSRKVVPNWQDSSTFDACRAFEDTMGGAEALARVTGSKAQLTYKPMPEDDPKQRRPDISKAKRLLGWEPQVPLAEGLQKSLEYFKGKI